VDPELTDEEFHRIYGPTEPPTLTELPAFFAGADFRWWVCGGWSLELGQAPRRLHDDLEIGIDRSQLALVREFLADYHLWDVHAGALVHLARGVEVPDDHEQLWLRRDAYSPWLMDLMLTPIEEGRWLYKRDRRVSLPLDEAIRVGSDGIPRQRPEIGLLFKARRRVDRDEDDFAAVVPTLSAAERGWLRDAIELTEPRGNPWLDRL
jgi:Aminoglycoside-2''-adenylyltransferase